MSWVRIHDGAMQNLKITVLSDSAFRLWVRGLCYCQTALTDGLIPYAALRDMGARRREIDVLSSPQVEGRAPLWETHALGFKVHDYLDWNDCRDKVVDRQNHAKDRKAAYDAKRKAERAAVKERVPNTSPLTHERTASITKPNQTKEEQEQKPVRPKEPADPRVREFLTWFGSEYKARLHGAAYLVKWGKHGAIVKPMLKAVELPRLQRLALLLLTTDESWVEGTDRGIEVLSAKFNWLESRLAAWEAKHKVSA